MLGQPATGRVAGHVASRTLLLFLSTFQVAAHATLRSGHLPRAGTRHRHPANIRPVTPSASSSCSSSLSSPSLHRAHLRAFADVTTPPAQAPPSSQEDRGIFEADYPQVVDEAAMLRKSEFPIQPEELIMRTKDFMNKKLKDWGSSALSDDFQFIAPVVGPLSKDAFIQAITGFAVEVAFPDNNGRYYNFGVDPFEPDRVWFTSRGIGTNTGVFGGMFPPTGKVVESPPQAMSLKFNEQGQITQLTVGYVMDRMIGNTGGLGGIFGLLYAIGRPLPFPEGKPWKMSTRYKLFNLFGRLRQKFQKKN